MAEACTGILVDFSEPDSPVVSDYHFSASNSLHDVSNEENECKTGILLNLSDDINLVINKTLQANDENSSTVKISQTQKMDPQIILEVAKIENVVSGPKEIASNTVDVKDNVHKNAAEGVTNGTNKSCAMKGSVTEDDFTLLEAFEHFSNINFDNIKFLDDEEFDFDLSHFSPQTAMRKKRESAMFRMSLSKLSEEEMQKIFQEARQLAHDISSKTKANNDVNSKTKTNNEVTSMTKGNNDELNKKSKSNTTQSLSAIHSTDAIMDVGLPSASTNIEGLVNGVDGCGDKIEQNYVAAVENTTLNDGAVICGANDLLNINCVKDDKWKSNNVGLELISKSENKIKLLKSLGATNASLRKKKKVPTETMRG